TGTTATVNGGNIVFKNTQRVFELERSTGSNSGSLFFKPSSKKKKQQVQKTKIDQRKKIRLMFDSPKGYHRQLLVGVDENASDGFDLGYDGLLSDLGKEDMYWDFSGGKFVIQAVNDFNKEKEILLGIQIEEAGLIKIAIDKLENIAEDTSIYIKDKLTGDTHDITNQAFEINLEAGEYVNRFVLAFQPRLKTLEEIALFEGIQVFMNNTNAEIQLNKIIDAEILDVTLFNYLGQQIRSWNTNLNERIVTLPIQITTGAYIVKVTTNAGIITKKIIIE
ncbi:T9SS type A sorting domain-containing protein, partial [Lutibacter sp.]